MPSDMPPLVRTFSQRTLSPGVTHTSLRSNNQPASAQSFAWPSSISSKTTQAIRQIGLEAKADITGNRASISQTFEQLRNDLANDNMLSELGRFAIDDLRD